AELSASRCVVRISVPPASAPKVVAAIEPDRYLLDWGGGLIWAGDDDVASGRVRAAIPEGHATLGKAPRALRESVEVFPPLPAKVAELAARLKAAFDPAGRLNPGRMGRLGPHPEIWAEKHLADAFRCRSARRSRSPRSREDPAQVRALRILHRDVPDVRAARRRARQPPRANLLDQGHARARPARDEGDRAPCRSMPVVPRMHDDVSVGRALPAFDRSCADAHRADLDRKSTRLNSSHVKISYAVFCLKKKKKK